ncbi:thiopeptide-type bacteriocin biosynthesis protein [Chryseobacterium gotjawalense]|uniref:Thiopeptide-type bacteriocin biosynthesis protein n=1 Tax=Chryseobacterium gotjawalense TaxID=3042315 RepID=A0ABY8RDM6_9FLAO|nr:thiopeptide-type bacteriocin biosynthesis protein [Chryseobacterium sp. wdc7]WHF51936.1 thiopeptide-type bacteriocin biosynthesis protein [Chryseobacterium sp. wdc7]
MAIRKFLPGSEWLYFKIYAGVKTSDIILQEAIIPLVNFLLKEEQLIIKWFFIRYNDPKPHLRIRFQLVDNSNYESILEKVNHQLKDFIDSGEITNIMIDSYKRELERYGENTIEFAEVLFCKSSELVINFLEYNDEEKIIVSMFYIDKILSKLKLSDAEKCAWISKFNNSYKKEFNADKNLNTQLDIKFRKFKPDYIDFVKSDENAEIRNLIILNIEKSGVSIENIVSIPFLSDFFQSIFHMHINRTFISNQRLFEMIIYDYINRYYKALINNKKYSGEIR